MMLGASTCKLVMLRVRMLEDDWITTQDCKVKFARVN
jgi:hypothetical protein